MTRSSLFSRFAAAIFSSALIFALTVDILDEIPNGEQPPAAVERAPITSPQLDGPYFQQAEVEAEVKAEGATAPVVSAAVETLQAPETAAPTAAEAASASPQMAN